MRAMFCAGAFRPQPAPKDKPVCSGSIPDPAEAEGNENVMIEGMATVK